MMQLTRVTVPVASRTTLPVYAEVSLVLGLSYLFWPLNKLLSNPVLAQINEWVALRAWGGLFFGLALWQFWLLRHWRTTKPVGLHGNDRSWFVGSLYLTMIIQAVFAVAGAAAGLTGGTTPSAWVMAYAMARFAYASVRSLEGEPPKRATDARR